MNRTLLTCLSLFCLGIARAQTPTLSGTWMGKIGGTLPVIFHFDRTPAGDVTGTMDCPPQGAVGLPLVQVRVGGDSLVCVLETPQAQYVAFRTNDSTYTGLWKQGAQTPLEIHRLRGAAATAYAPPDRPQTPRPPFPYHSDSVEYDNTDGTVHLGATLTYPISGGPFAAAILITGSGIEDRDESVFGHKPFAVIADYLTRRGFAVLRVDDRTAGKSRGEVVHATSADFAGDVETSLAYLRTRKEVDPARIGLIGHSEGGMIAPMVAAADPRVAFIILLAGPVEGGYGTMLYQALQPLIWAGASPAYVAFIKARQALLLQQIATAPDTAALFRGVDSTYKGLVASHTESFVTPPAEYMTAIRQQASAVTSPWLKFFLEYDPRPDFRKITCPILALGGDKDFQVHDSLDLALLPTLVSDAEKPRVETHLMPGLNHLFQHCKTCTSTAEYGKLDETFSPEVLKIMGDWMERVIDHEK